jgi:hypothetical protein
MSRQAWDAKVRDLLSENEVAWYDVVDRIAGWLDERDEAIRTLAAAAQDALDAGTHLDNWALSETAALKQALNNPLITQEADT